MRRTLTQRTLMMTALMLAVGLLSAIWLNTRISAQEQAAAKPAEETMEQKHKNIQALKGVPASQLYPIMNQFNVALGADCVFCHVKNGDQWEWDKDDKRAKQTARRMIQLTLDLNKNFFQGRPQVSCYTCHQGEEHPRGVAALPRDFAEKHEEAARPASGWPTPQQILDKYTQAVGGADAAAKLSSRVLKGSYLTARNQSFPLELKIAGPDKWVQTMTVPGAGAQSVGVNGSASWLKDNRENRPLSPLELSRFSSQAKALEPLQIAAPYPRLNFGGKTKVGDREAWILGGMTPDRKRVRYFFDTQTGLLLRRTVISETVVGQDPEQTDYEDYRDVNGVKIPFTIRTSYLDAFFSATRKLTEVKAASLDDAQFNPPAK
ncbi:MAG: c-type cytochrome [Blastocatellia bacterium]